MKERRHHRQHPRHRPRPGAGVREAGACGRARPAAAKETVDRAVAEIEAVASRHGRGARHRRHRPGRGPAAVGQGQSPTWVSVDLWINNAGVAHTTADIVDTDVDDIRTMVTTNMLGTIYGSQVAVRGMAAQPRGGQVFNMLGGGSDGKIRPNMGVYSATKRGLDLFTAGAGPGDQGLRCARRPDPARPADHRGVAARGRPRSRAGLLAASDPQHPARRRRRRGALPGRADAHLDEAGDAIAWLTTGRLTKRFMTPGFAKKHDVLARHGL